MHIIGLMRSTILYLAIISVIKESSFQLLFLYVFIIALHLMFLKLKREDFSAGEIAIGSIIHDTLAPFLGVKSFVKLLLQKYLDSPNEPHANIFLAQGITEAIWSVLLIVYLVTAVS